MPKDYLTLEELGAAFGGRAELVSRGDMQITREFLVTEIKSLEAQRANAHAVLNQAMGAIAFAEAMLNRLDKEPEPSGEPDGQQEDTP